jgi:hypothetical protein
LTWDSSSLRLAVGGVVLAHGLIKIGWPITMGARGTAAVRGMAGFFGPAWLIVMLAGDVTLLVIGPFGRGLPKRRLIGELAKLVHFHRIGLDLSSRPVDRHHMVPGNAKRDWEKR